MNLPPDYHMHTPLCRHARGEPEEYARRALAIGLTEIGFSDHSPMMRDDFDAWRMRLDQLDEYVEKIQRVQRDFPGLTTLLALEVDYLPEHEDWIRELAALHPWDYLIGSVHYLPGNWVVDHHDNLPDWEARDVWEIWSSYFDRLTMAAASGLFDVIGHPDLPKKFGHRPTRDCTPLYERFLDSAVRHACALDINTAGLRKPCAEIYPSREFLQLAFDRGVPITFGSDAHAPDEVGMNFGEAVQLARSVGYRESSRFARRRATPMPVEP
ncbi:MAG: histidinol-phosphatase HisJ family protein [Candidatus Eisenbacteria bacterium]